MTSYATKPGKVMSDDQVETGDKLERMGGKPREAGGEGVIRTGRVILGGKRESGGGGWG